MSIVFAALLSAFLGAHGAHCTSPTEPVGTQIAVNSNGNAVFATDTRPANYECNWYGRWVSTGRPVK